MATETKRKVVHPQGAHRDFTEGFWANLQAQEGKFDAKDGHLIRTERNTSLVLEALAKAAVDSGYIALAIFLAAACERVEPS